jgi:hypothetical protein
MKRKASHSLCGTFRVSLTREYDPTCTEKCCAGPPPVHRGYVVFIFNNPSIAGGDVDDPTVRRGWGYTRAWGYGAMMYLNTNPWVSTNPALARTPDSGVLDANDQWLRHAQEISAITVCGWGDKADPVLARRAWEVLHVAGPLHALRVTTSGNPQHPLYLPKALIPQIWKGERYQQ